MKNAFVFKLVWSSFILLSFVLATGAVSFAQQPSLTAPQQLARDIFKELIEINTTDTPAGDVGKAAEAMAARLVAAGFPMEDIRVLGPLRNKRNLVARIHGKGPGKPILFLAHLDVVEALAKDWSANLDPFKLNEVDGFFYGRGTTDIKEGDTFLMTTFIQLKQEGFVPSRDLILMLTADEEGGDSNGVQWLLKTHRDLIDAEYAVNTDAGDFEWQKGKRLLLGMETSEKNYVDFTLEVKSNGGHSSRPGKDNAINRLAAGLVRLGEFDFPVDLNETTRAFFERTASLQDAATAADFRAIVKNPADKAAAARLARSTYFNALMRTTCVATLLEGGHAHNALPQSAKANVNCRMLPDAKLADVENTLKKVLADDRISITVVGDPGTAPASPLHPLLMKKLEEFSKKLYGGIPVVPVMDTGASDGKYLRIGGIPTYGVPGVFMDVDDERAHGKDERVGVKDFYDGVEFYYLFVKSLAE